jgi:penicillin-binding protein 1A
MKAAHENKPRAEFPRPPGVVTVSIDPKTGKRAATEEGAIDEVFLDGTEPTETADAPKDDAGPGTSDAATTGALPTLPSNDAGTAP